MGTKDRKNVKKAEKERGRRGLEGTKPPSSFL